jgi:hypothetical protein
MELVIRPKGGIGNRFRVLTSYYLKYIKNTDKKLIVLWVKDKCCNGYFQDYFEPIPKVEFITNNDKKLKVNYCSCSRVGPVDFSIIKPLPHMIDKINEKRNLLNNDYIAIHARRTDHIAAAKKRGVFTTDEDFFKYIDENINDSCLYVATDNIDTYTMFQEKYKDKVKFSYHQTTGQYRNTSLEDAIIDIYMCTYAKKFKHSGWSTFSGVINNLRKILL